MSASAFLGLFGTTAAVLLAVGTCSPYMENSGNRVETVVADEALTEMDSDIEATAAYWTRQLASELEGMDESSSVRKLSVVYGSRTFNADTATYDIRWGEQPVNVVKIVARGGNPLGPAADHAVPVEFTGIFGKDGLLQGEAIAFTDAPDLIEAARTAEVAAGGSPAREAVK